MDRSYLNSLKALHRKGVKTVQCLQNIRDIAVAEQDFTDIHIHMFEFAEWAHRSEREKYIETFGEQAAKAQQKSILKELSLLLDNSQDLEEFRKMLQASTFWLEDKEE